MKYSRCRKETQKVRGNGKWWRWRKPNKRGRVVKSKRKKINWRKQERRKERLYLRGQRKDEKDRGRTEGKGNGKWWILDKIRKEIWEKKELSEERKDICFFQRRVWRCRLRFKASVSDDFDSSCIYFIASFDFDWTSFKVVPQTSVWLLSLTLGALGGAVNPSGPSRREMWQTGSFCTATFAVSAPQSSSARCSFSDTLVDVQR